MKKNYLIIGDSIAYGVGATDNGGFSNFLKSEISRITNLFISGLGLAMITLIK